MNIRDLEYLIAVVDCGHFGKAAERCFVSQPALSMQIKKLENTLGVQLLERTNNTVLLTEIGTQIVAKAQQILNQAREIRELAKASQDPFAGELKIGIIPTLAPYFLPLIISKLSKAFPKLSLYLIEAQTPALLEKLNQGEMDAAFLAIPITETNLTDTLLFKEEFLLATPKNHPLAKLKSVKPSHLENQNLLLLEEGHCLRDQILSFCETLHKTNAENFKATSLETLRHMISSGIGITLMPRLAAQSNDNICYIPFTKPVPHRTLGLVWRTSTAKQIVLEKIVEYIKLILQKNKAVDIIN
jgi:LysR family hydrogen peroxide-inducible transcriptional activator